MDANKGVKKTILNLLEDAKQDCIDKNLILSEEIIDTICNVTELTGREIAVYIDRKGEVLDINIGDENTVNLQNFDKRRSQQSLSGIRCIHTHPNGNGQLSDVDLSALKKLRFDIMVSIGVAKGKMSNSYISFLVLNESKELVPAILGPYSKHRFLKINTLELIEEIEGNLKSIRNISKEVKDENERAILVGIENEEALEELRELLKTAGGTELGRVVQNRDRKDTAYFIGKGKVKELTLLIQALEANLVVFDEELSGAQVRNLEGALGVKVIDRTQLILDIFALRAKTREGKLQVELAQLKYMLPRLIGSRVQLSRTGAGIGARGPGEKKLEIDRRRIRDRVNELEAEIKEMKKSRQLHRVNRENNNVFEICLVGYTNAGKSTLLNTLADANIYAKDQLFATLDPTTRKVTLNNGKEILVTDTVGFIRKLPHDLIQAFKSTLEVVSHADLLLHVVDGSNPEHDNQMRVVNDVIEELGAVNVPIITAINKVDKSKELQHNTANKTLAYISAKERIGLDVLLNSIEEYISLKSIIVDMIIPYTEGNITSMLHKNATIISEKYEEDGIHITAEMDKVLQGKLGEYIH